MGEAAGQQRLGSLLVELGFIDEGQLESALEAQQESGMRLGAILVEAAVLTEKRLVQALSRQLGIPTCEPLVTSIPEDILAKIPAAVAHEYRVIPIVLKQDELGRCLYVATPDPLDIRTGKAVRACNPGLRLRWLIAGENEIELALKRHYGNQPVGTSDIPVVKGMPIPPSTSDLLPKPEVATQSNGESFPALQPDAYLSSEDLIELKDDSMLGMDGVLIGRSAQAITSAIEAAISPRSFDDPTVVPEEMRMPPPPNLVPSPPMNMASERITEIGPLPTRTPPKLGALSSLSVPGVEDNLSWGDLISDEEPTKAAEENVIRDLAEASRDALAAGDREDDDIDSFDVDIDVQTMSLESEQRSSTPGPSALPEALSDELSAPSLPTDDLPETSAALEEIDEAIESVSRSQESKPEPRRARARSSSFVEEIDEAISAAGVVELPEPLDELPELQRKSILDGSLEEPDDTDDVAEVLPLPEPVGSSQPDAPASPAAGFRPLLERFMSASATSEEAQQVMRVLAAVLMDEGWLSDERLERALKRLEEPWKS